ncbi:uroporphyrinogen-III synthase [Jiella sp. M17.18]|uniref:uroporphyrinogen-III synthase n=1 Tax=Jiella sp. M17.18 TaxID=3234247 RepID=UPI0034DE5257
MARVLILREAADAGRTASDLAALGHEPLLLPVEETRSLDDPPPPGRFAGFAVTSARAVPALAAHFPGDARPVFAVGERTAAAARAAGLPHVQAAPGTADAIGQLALATGLEPGDHLLYAAGRRRTGTLETALTAASLGFAVWEVYAVVPVEPDAAVVRAALGGVPPDAVLILSAGQAEAFGRLAARHPGLFEPLPTLLALSARIAEALPPALAGAARISPTPRLASLFEWLG